MGKNTVSLNGIWYADYLSGESYLDTKEPKFNAYGVNGSEDSCVTEIRVPGYFEDMLDDFRSTPLHAKLKWNPLYTLQRYPQVGYVPDMALPNPVGCFVCKKKFIIEDFHAGECELYVGGVQNALSAWINGNYIGRHEGYSSEFFLPIPKEFFKEGENEITLTISNTRLKGYKDRPISGLTSRAANECTGGIYGDVELRFYPDGLRDVWVSTSSDITSFTVKTVGGENSEGTVRIFDGEKLLAAQEMKRGECDVTFSTEGFSLWSPSHPKLYTVTVSKGETVVTQKFGIRRFTSKGTSLYLNGAPYFFKGVCEHCYQPMTVHPTRDKSYYRRVIRTLKELGFNSIRFHTWVPMAEYMEAADELGILIEVETPNNTTYSEWQDIVKFCRHYTSVCAYSSGNEMVIDEDYIEHLRACAEFVHGESDSLFSPMSAMRGIEYFSYGDCRVDTPFPHNPKRLSELDTFCDLYNTYSLGLTSYESEHGTHTVLDERNAIYKHPLLSHEICIQGTYIDLSLKDRYRGTRIGDTEFMSSVEKHLADVGLIDKAPLYYRNSAAWQRVLRKHCFETLRRCESFAGYDFLGDIDTHWHTFGYCVGMMNEFYELKPTETVRNVIRYNGDTVLLADLPQILNFTSGDKLTVPILVSNYGERIEKGTLLVRLSADGEVILRREIRTGDIKNGRITELYRLNITMPKCDKPKGLKLSVTLFGGNTDCENEWDLYLFPKMSAKIPGQALLKSKGLTVANEMDAETLVEKMEAGERVLLLGTGPFNTVKTTFQLSVAGRTTGHLATVIGDHPIVEDLPHDGFCSWQFRGMMSGASTAVLNVKSAPHEPIIDIASTYKNARKEAMLFEYEIGAGKLLVCTLALRDTDPAALWLKQKMITYALSDAFLPKNRITKEELIEICSSRMLEDLVNENAALNKNDITMA